MFEDGQALNWINKSFKLKYYPKLTAIFKQGDIGVNYYIILRGKVQCLIDIAQGKDDNQSLDKNVKKIQNVKKAIHNMSMSGNGNNSQNINKSQVNQQLEKKSAADVISQMYSNTKKVFEYFQGQSFGEIALITNQRRTATMVCEEDTYCMELSKSGYEKIVGSYQKMVISEKIQFFRKYNIFQNMTDAKVLSMMASIKLVKYESRQIIFKEGDPLNEIYFIKSGEIEFSRFYDFAKEEEIQKQRQLQKEKMDKHQELQSLNYNNILKDNNQLHRRLKLLYMSTGQYFGEEEIILNTNIRKSKAVVKSLGCELYIMSMDFFMNTLRSHNMVQILKKENQYQQEIEESRINLIEKIQKDNQQQYQKKMKKMRIQSMDIENSEDIKSFRKYIQVQQEVKKKQKVKKKNKLQQYQDFPVIEKQPIPVRFTVHKHYNTIKEQFNDTSITNPTYQDIRNFKQIYSQNNNLYQLQNKNSQSQQISQIKSWEGNEINNNDEINHGKIKQLIP